MGIYSNAVFPALYDMFMDQPFLARHRREQLKRVEGEILEIGAGTGLNLPHYPKHVRRITAVDPNPGMNRKLARRIKQLDIAVDRLPIGSEELPFAGDTFDCIVSTLTLCSIRRLYSTLGELFRVLKSGGRFVFFEHGLSPDDNVRKWQRRLNRIQRFLADGCRLDLDVDRAVASQPFRSVEIDTFYMEKSPRTHGFIYRGTAVK